MILTQSSKWSNITLGYCRESNLTPLRLHEQLASIKLTVHSNSFSVFRQATTWIRQLPLSLKARTFARVGCALRRNTWSQLGTQFTCMTCSASNAPTKAKLVRTITPCLRSG